VKDKAFQDKIRSRAPKGPEPSQRPCGICDHSRDAHRRNEWQEAVCNLCGGSFSPPYRHEFE